MVQVRGGKGFVNVQVYGAGEVVQFLAKKNILIQTQLEKGLIRAGNMVQTEVQESILGNRGLNKAVDTGRLANSIKVRPMGVGKIEGVKVVSEKSKYPGTQTSTEDVAALIEYGTSTTSARPNFRNTAARTKAEVKEILNASIEKV